MADAIPVSDAGLLAAQAQSGQDGVNAYKNAIAAMQAQKQQAVQGAMQEAALRGSPQGAMESQQSIITGPYDQRIASLTQGLGSYQASEARRAGMRQDYSDAVQEARTYIPQVTEQSVAPIRAMADYQVRNTEMEGQQRVAGINAERELTLAKMQAALQAAQIAARKKAATDNKLSQGELSSMMSRGAQESLRSGRDESQRVLGSNEAEVAQAIAGAHDQAAGVVNKAQANRRDVNKVLTLAQLILRATLENDAKKHPVYPPGHLAPQSLQPRGPMPSHDENGHLIMRDYAAPQTTVPAAGAAPIAPPEPAPDPNANFAQRYGQLMQSVAVRTAQIRRQANQQVTQAAAGYYPYSILQAAGQAMKNRTTYDPLSGSRVLVSQDQEAGLSPQARALLYGGQVGNINTLGDFNRQVIGAPTVRFGHLTGPQPSEYSSTAVRDAMLRSAQGLQGQGYTITDAEAQNAMPTKGQSIYDFLADASGSPSAQQDYTTALAEQTSGDKEATTAQTTQADSDIRNEFGHTLSPSLGTSVQIASALSDPATLQQFDGLVEALRSIRTGWKDDKNKPTRDNLVAKLEANAADSGTPINQWLLSLALEKLGL